MLERTLATLRSQTHADLRILISVDRSEDDSLAVCRRMQAADRRITVLAQERRLGFVENVNFLVARAEGDFFCVTPQDDLLAPDYVASLLRALEERPGAALAYADLVHHDTGRRVFQGSLLGDPAERILGYLARQVSYVEWRGLVRSSCVDGSFRFVGGENVDQALPLKLAIRGELIRVPRPLYRKTHPPRSATTHQYAQEAGRLQRLADSLESCFSCHGLAVAALPDAGLRELARTALLLRCMNFVLRTWPDGRAGPESEAEARAFGALLRHRSGDALLAHRSLAGRSDLERRHPRVLATLKATSLFHLAVTAEQHLGAREAAALMRRAVEIDPALAGTDPLHASICRRILGDDPRATPPTGGPAR